MVQAEVQIYVKNHKLTAKTRDFHASRTLRSRPPSFRTPKRGPERSAMLRCHASERCRLARNRSQVSDPESGPKTRVKTLRRPKSGNQVISSWVDRSQNPQIPEIGQIVNLDLHHQTQICSFCPPDPILRSGGIN